MSTGLEYFRISTKKDECFSYVGAHNSFESSPTFIAGPIRQNKSIWSIQFSAICDNQDAFLGKTESRILGTPTSTLSFASPPPSGDQEVFIGRVGSVGEEGDGKGRRSPRPQTGVLL